MTKTVFELNTEQRNMLFLAMGYAMGAAFERDRSLFDAFNILLNHLKSQCDE